MKKNNAIEALDAFAQERRLDIFRLLVQGGKAVKISERLGLRTATLALHLKTLKRAGLMGSRMKATY